MTTRQFVEKLAYDGVRLWEEKGNLRFRAPKGVINDEIKTQLSKRKTEIISILRHPDYNPAKGFLDISPDFENRNKPFPLSDVQSAYLIGRSNAFELGNISCHAYYELENLNIDIERLNRALNRLIRKHETLRLVFSEDGSQEILKIVPEYKVNVIDFRKHKGPEAEAESEHEKIRKSISHQVHDISLWPLFDIGVIRFKDKNLIYFSVDLLISDFYSGSLLFKDLVRFYEQPDLISNSTDFSFRDYVLTEQDFSNSEEYTKSKKYWMNRLDSFPGYPNLPFLKSPSLIKKPLFIRREARLEKGVWEKFKRHALEFELTPSVILLAAYSEVLARWSRNDDFAINLTLFNRLPVHKDVMDVAGDFTDVNLLEVNSGKGISFIEKAKAIQERLWEDIENRHFSGVRFLREIARFNNSEGKALMPVVFSSTIGVENKSDNEINVSALGELKFSITQTPQVFLDHQALEHDGVLFFNWDAVEAIFPENMLDSMFESYCEYLDVLAKDISSWNELFKNIVSIKYPRSFVVENREEEIKEFYLHSMFKNQVEKTPEHNALISAAKTLTYKELDNISAGISDLLFKNSTKPGKLVAVVMERGWEQVAGALGILRSGGAYLPVDSAAPFERLNHILDDAGVDIVLTQSKLENKIVWPENIKVISVDTINDFSLPSKNKIRNVNPQDLAYVIYTSGSTGKPKGVMIDHKSAVNTIIDINKRFNIDSNDKIISLAAMNFDLSVYDYFGTLSAGAAIVIPDHDKANDPDHWLDLIEKEKITVWNSVPQLMQMLLDFLPSRPKFNTRSLRLVMMSGDWIPVNLPGKINRFFNNAELISLGGATEASIWSILYPIKEADKNLKSIPYGKAMTNQKVYVLSRDLDFCPVWTTGDIYISGAGLAKGYLNDEEKTKASFIFHPDTRERLYKTGDLGRYLPDGNIEFLGREDSQVKLSGYRIELGEIQSAINEHPDIKDSVVLLADNKNKEKILGAYLVVENNSDGYGSIMESIESAEIDYDSITEPGSVVFVDFEKEDNELFYSYIEKKSLEKIVDTLNSLNIFEENRSCTFSEILEKGGIDKSYQKLIQQWLEILCDKGLIEKKGYSFTNLRFLKENLENIFKRIRNNEIQKSAEKIGLYIEKLSVYYKDLLQGKKDALDLFFNEKPDLSPEKLSRIMPCTELTDITIKSIVTKLADNSLHKTAVSILELGARSGESTGIIADIFKTENTKYTISDSSRFFTQKLNERFDFLQTKEFDIEKDPLSQGLADNSYDAVFAFNSLHRAKNLRNILKNIRKILSPGGALIISENTINSIIQKVSVGFIEKGFSGLDDERRDSGLPLLSSKKWISLLKECGFESIYSSFGEKSRLTGNDVILAKAPLGTKKISHEKLGSYLKDKLPRYMIPDFFLELDKIPLTNNGKVDIKSLPIPKSEASILKDSDELPQTETEKIVAAIWQEVLKIENPGINLNFFDIGGDSLVGTRLVAKLRSTASVEVSLRLLFENPTIKKLAKAMDSRTRRENKPNGIPQIKADFSKMNLPFPVTDVQYAYIMGRSGLYELGKVGAHCYFEYNGFDPDLDKLNVALNRLINHHPMMRSFFVKDGSAQQILEKVPEYKIQIYDFNRTKIEEALDELEHVRSELSHQIISTDVWPLFDIRISLHSINEFRLHISFDNSVFDGWSMFHLISELSRLYNDQGALLSDINFTFRDYVLGMEKIKETDQYARDKKYWLDRLENIPPCPDLPMKEHPEQGTFYPFKRFEHRFDLKKWNKLKEIGKESGVTPSGLLLAAYSEVLRSRCSNNQFTINLTTFNRTQFHEHVNKMIGDFTSLSLLQVDTKKGENFTKRAKNLQKQLWEDIDHPYYSGVEVLRELGKIKGARENARMPFVFTSALGFENFDQNIIDDNYLGKLKYSISQTPQVLLDHQVYETSYSLVLIWDTVEELFPEHFIKDMFDSYLNLLESLSADKAFWSNFQTVKLLSSQRKKRIEVNKTDAEIPDALLYSFFEEQVKKNPTAKAVVSSDKILSYQELSDYSDNLRNILIRNNAKPNRLICILMDKGWEQVVSALGILKSGAAYLPVSHDTPFDRLNKILTDAGVDIVLSQSFLKNEVDFNKLTGKGISVLFTDELSPRKISSGVNNSQITSENLAYVIYTSGSTGAPKGVMIDHRGALNTILDINKKFSVSSLDNVFCLSAMNFDLSVYDIFGTLSAGATLIVPDRDKVKEPAYWFDLVKSEGITIWNSVPQLMEMFVDYLESRPKADFETLRLILMSGDWISLNLPLKIKKYFNQSDIVSLGGATEASIWSIYHKIMAISSDWKSIPYGRPLTNQKMYILNENMEDCPDWVAGNIYIGGKGIAKGYWKDKKKTESSFIERTGNDEKIYKTGDMGRYLPDGNIEFIGRKDDQVKLNGYRVELGEIESAVNAHPDIKQSVVLVSSGISDSKKVIAYIKLNESAGSLVVDKEKTIIDYDKFINYLGKLSVSAISDEIGASDFDKFKEFLDKISLKYILSTLNEIGIFNCDKKELSFVEIIKTGKIKKGYESLILQWLEFLSQNGLVKKGIDNKFVFKVENIKLENLFDRLVNNKNLIDCGKRIKVYLENISKDFKKMIQGEKDPMEVFFSDYKKTSPEILSKMNPATAFIENLLCNIVEFLLSKGSIAKPLKIIQIGTRSGEFSEILISSLKDKKIDYLVTDESSFYTSILGERFGKYDFVKTKLFNPEQDLLSNDPDFSDFDLVLAVNSLHRYSDINKSIKTLKTMLSPGGALIMLESTIKSSLQNISVNFLENNHLEDFDKIPEQRSNLLTSKTWIQMLDIEGFEDSVSVMNTFSDSYGQDIIVSRKSGNSKQLDRNKLKKYLKKFLPDYMLPFDYVQLSSIPLNKNGKIDRNKISEFYDVNPQGNKEDNYIPPQSESEILMADIWKRILKTEEIGLNSNFFNTGGDSLLGTRIIARVRELFNIDINLRMLFEFPTVKELTDKVDNILSEKHVQPDRNLPSVFPDKDNIHIPFSLTDVQHAYLMGRKGLYRLGSVSAHCYIEFDAKGIDLNKLSGAVNFLIRRHDMMRAVFLINDMKQKILTYVPEYKIRVYDLKKKGAGETESELLKIRKRLSHQIVNIEKWPLFDINVSLLNDADCRIHISFDNIVFDGWSMFYILTELSKLYKNINSALPDFELSFRDYVLGLEKVKHSKLYKEDQEYWLSKINDLPLSPKLPLKKDVFLAEKYRFSRFEYILNEKKWKNLKNKAKEIGITPSGLLLSAYAEIINSRAVENKFTINLTTFNRIPFHEQVNDLIGDFTSLTLLSVDMDKNFTFEERTKKLQSQLWQDMDHPYFSGVEVLRELAKLKGGVENAGMPIVFTSSLGFDVSSDAIEQSSLGVLNYGISQTPQVLIDHQVSEQSGKLITIWDTAKDFFPDGFLDEMFNSYIQFIEQLSDEEKIWQKKKVINLPAQQRILRNKINSWSSPPPELMLYTQFEKNVLKNPGGIAVSARDKKLTYAQLSDFSNILAANLVNSGVEKDSLVAVFMDKGWEPIVSVLGVVKSGAAYLPISTDTPIERLKKILTDGEVKVVLTQSRYKSRFDFNDIYKLFLIDNIDFSLKQPDPIRLGEPENLAYVIYTSGSTGMPKGVMIDHKSAVNTLVDINKRFNIGSSDKVLALSNLNFDLSVYDIWGLLSAGGTVVIPDNVFVKDPAHWAELIESEKVTVWNSVPALMHMLTESVINAEAYDLSSLRLTLLSGDWIPVDLPGKIKSICTDTEIISLGGATEASIWSIIYPVKEIDLNLQSILYGKPLTNQSFHVLSKDFDECPDWVTGELFIGGYGLSKGYWKDSKKTSKSFIYLENGELLYKTGDLGRYLPDGNIEFIGRKDFQVKINGYRIELGDIESAMNQYHGVKEALSLAKTINKNDHIIGYVVTSEHSDFLLDDFIDYLGKNLNDYMVPSKIILLDSLPLSSNGKIDRKKLPDADISSFKQDKKKKSPSTDLEILIADTVKLHLGIEDISIEDKFFDLGCNSLNIVNIHNKLSKELSVKMSVTDIFEYSSIEKLAEHLSTKKTVNNEKNKMQENINARKSAAMKRSRTFLRRKK